ncbi:MAG: hypothetical protein ACOVNU_12825 [Candidatus Kapaibacteriota bacterium]|jgi:hypothetical protein
MDKKIKFANIFNNNTYEPDKDDDEDAYDISPADMLIQDIDLKQNYNSRYRFYTELLKIYNKNPKIIRKVYTKLNAIKDLNGMEKKLLSELIYYNNKLDNTTVGGASRASRAGRASRGGSSILKGYKESKMREVLKKDYDMPNISKLNKNINERNQDPSKETGDKITDFNNQIDKYYDDRDDGEENLYNKKIKNESTDDENQALKNLDKNIKKKIIEFENDPENTFNYLELTIEDRLVFIITTFFIRYLSLILIQWSVDINIIKSFEEGFFYYAVIYLAIFWFIVLFVNIDNTTKVDYMNFDNFMNSIRSVFYYFYMGTNGITRLLVHSCIICVLLIVPIILNIKKSTYIEEENNDKDKNIISYEERKKLSKSLSLFTIFIWVLTSIIATKF